MNWTFIILGLFLVLGFFTIVGLVKSLLRLAIALGIGILAALATTWIVPALGLSETVPDIVVLVVGALAALSILLRR